MNIYEILELLKDRRGMLLGSNYTFDSLDSFINGYMIAASKKRLEGNNYPNFSYFNTWVIGHLKKKPGLFGWHWQIRQRNPTNDEKAFDEFFLFLNVFKKSRLYKKTLSLDNNALEFFKKSQKRTVIKNEKSRPDKRLPVKIIWEQLQHSTTIWITYIDKKDKFISGSWYINSAEATKSLRQEFGILNSRWVSLKSRHYS